MAKHPPKTGKKKPTTKAPTEMAVMRAAASELLSRAQLASAAGITFNGKRDLYIALGYNRTLTLKDYRERFERDPIAARVVSAFPKATWRGGAELVEDDDPETITDFEQVWMDFGRRVRLWPSLSRTDVLAGVGRYAVLLIGAPGDMKDELPRGTSLDEVAYLQPYAEEDATIAEWDVEPSSPRYGMPLSYDLRRVHGDMASRSGGSAGRTQRTHWSRIIHVPDGALDDEVYGTPRLKAIWNRLDDLDKIVGGGAEAFWLRAHPGYHLNLDPEIEFGDGEEEALSDEIDEFEHGFRRTVRTRGLDMKTLSADVADLSKPADAVLGLISAGTGIPKRILLGSERGELASSQDKNNFDQRVADRRKDFAEPFCVHALVDRLIEYGYSPAADYHAVWPQEQDLSDSEKGQLGKTMAGINREAGDVVVTPDEIREVLGRPPLADVVDEDTLAEMRERLKPSGGQVPGQDNGGDGGNDGGSGDGATRGRPPVDDAEGGDDEEGGADDRAARRLGARAAGGRRGRASDAARAAGGGAVDA